MKAQELFELKCQRDFIESEKQKSQAIVDRSLRSDLSVTGSEKLQIRKKIDDLESQHLKTEKERLERKSTYESAIEMCSKEEEERHKKALQTLQILEDEKTRIVVELEEARSKLQNAKISYEEMIKDIESQEAAKRASRDNELKLLDEEAQTTLRKREAKEQAILAEK